MKKLYLIFTSVLLLISIFLITHVNAKSVYTNNQVVNECSALMQNLTSFYNDFCKSHKMTLNSFDFKDYCTTNSITCSKDYGDYFTLTKFYLK